MKRLAALLLATTAVAAPKPNEVPPDWAPSTGKEMQKAAPQQGTVALEKQLAVGFTALRAAKTKEACNRALDPTYTAALRLNVVPSAKTAPVFEALARCARLAKRYQVLEVVAQATAGTQIGRTSDLALALIGQDRRADAAKEIAAKLASAPTDPFLLTAKSRLACKQRDFVTCRDAAKAALASKAKDPELASAHAMAQVSLWLSNLMIGDYAAARAAAKAMPTGPLRDMLAKPIVSAERAKLAVDIDASDAIPLGVYHLAGGVNAAPFELTFGNADKRDRELRVEVEIAGVTQKTVKTVVVLGKRAEHISLTPPLLATFATADIRAPRKVNLDVKVTEGDKVLYERSIATSLLPRDYLPTWERTSADTKRITFHNMGAWVTPNDPAVEQFLGVAKQRLVGRQSFSGPQSTTLAQVQALYDELKARGMAYVMDPAVNSDQFIGQRTRLPSEVLATTDAQCLEGTLLFASLLEAIGLKPIIVTVPGHAFIGWHASAKDPKDVQAYFVETTMVHTGELAQAMQVATRRVAEEQKHGTFKTGASRFIEVVELRAKGITPQPSSK
jgi:hypothetical protein